VWEGAGTRQRVLDDGRALDGQGEYGEWDCEQLPQLIRSIDPS
jgi:hypothetical protein